jgi:putative ABC transport system permease protein
MVRSFMVTSMAMHSNAHSRAITQSLRWLWWRFSIRRVLYNPLRVGIVLFSIGLATALWSAVTTVGLASVSSFEEGLGVQERRFDLLVSPVGGRLHTFEVAPCLSALSPYASALVIRRESGTVVFGGVSKAISVAAVSEFPSSHKGDAQVTQGIVSSSLMRELQIPEGGEVVVNVAGEAILTTATLGDNRTGSYSGEFDLVVPIESLRSREFIDTVAIDLHDNGARVSNTTPSSWLLACLGKRVPIRVERIEEPIARSEQLLAAYRFNITIMACITLVVCALLVSQATHLALPAVLRELAILRTLGVSNVACFTMVVLEGLALSALGALCGYTLGYPFIVWLTGFLLATATEIYHVKLSGVGSQAGFSQGVVVVLGMTLVGAIAAAVGARGVLAIAPYRGTRREQVHLAPIEERLALNTARVGSAVCAVVLVSLCIFRTTILAYLGVGAVLLWGACVVPYALREVARWMPKRTRGVESWLAESSLAASGRNFVLSAIAACIAVALMTGLSLMVSSFRETLSRWSESRLVGDLFISTSIDGDGNQARIAPQHLAAVQAVRGVKRAIPYYETGSTVGAAAVVIGGVSLTTQCERAVYPFVAGGCVPPGTSWGNQTIISESAARKLSLTVGDRLILDGSEFHVQAIAQEFGTEQPLLVLDEGEFLKLYHDHNPKTVTIDLLESEQLEVARAALQQIAPQELVVRDHQQLLSLVETLFNRTFRVTESVRWIVFSVAMLGLVSTSAQYLWERRREWKTLLVLGIPTRTLVCAVALEALGVTAASLLLGLCAGIAIGWCLTMYINPLVFGWSLSFSVSSAPGLEALLFSLGVVGGTALVSARIFRLISDGVRLADE